MLDRFKYFYLIQIMCIQLYGFKYFKQLYDFKFNNNNNNTDKPIDDRMTITRKPKLEKKSNNSMAALND